MPYVRKTISKKKPYKKRYTRSGATFRKKVARIAKTVALRQQETKHYHQSIASGQAIYHNTWSTIRDNLITVPSNGANDNRTGDEITLRGIKLYIYTEHPIDRPNVNWRIVIGRLAPNASGLVRGKGITGRTLNDPLDMDYYQKIHVDKRFNIKCDTYGDGVGSNRKQYSRCTTIWLPLNNYKYRFENHSTTAGRDWELQLGMTAFDVDGTLTSDILGTVSIASVLYFKDA